MSRVCKCASICPYAPEQTTAGCPAADLCPGYTEPGRLEYTTGTPPAPVFEINGVDYSHHLRGPFDVSLDGQRIATRAIYKEKD